MIRPTTKAKQRVFVDDVIKMLRILRGELYNRRVAPKRKTSAPRVTPKIRAKARVMHAKGMAMQTIARRLNISIGRVSEAVSGKRK